MKELFEDEEHDGQGGAEPASRPLAVRSTTNHGTSATHASGHHPGTGKLTRSSTALARHAPAIASARRVVSAAAVRLNQSITLRKACSP